MMLRIYTASKLAQAARWRAMNEIHADVFFHARWLKHNTLGTEDSPEEAAHFWLQDEQDVRDADATFVFAEEGEHLRGALVEAGMSIAYGVPVVVIGKHPDYGTWQYHPLVHRASDFAEAIRFVSTCIEPRYKRMRRHDDTR